MKIGSCATRSANLYRLADCSSPLETQLLLGEDFEILPDKNTQISDTPPSDKWLFGQTRLDHYQGFVKKEEITFPQTAPTHIISTSRAIIYQKADVKSLALDNLGLGARVRVIDDKNGFYQIEEGGFITKTHTRTLDDRADDFVAIAQSLIGTPYIWGGRDSALGIDCSALIQLCLAQTGILVARDSADQEKTIGKPITKSQKRGDLVFWKAHVGIMVDDKRLIHANAFHMSVAIEPLEIARQRIKPIAGEISSIKRL